MSSASGDPTRLLRRALESGRIHTGYLLSGDPEAALAAAETFARALVCQQGGPSAPCDACGACLRSAGSSASTETIELDGKGKRGPYLRHLGDHPDLYWIGLGADDTRVTIEQVRALQRVLRLGANEGGRVVAVLADAEHLSVNAQNALLRVLEEPPDGTTLLIVTATAVGLAATIRSRCQRVIFPISHITDLRGPDVDEEVIATVGRLDRLDGQSVPELLNWAEEFRGDRARAAEKVQGFLETGGSWLRERATRVAREHSRSPSGELDAFHELQRCRKDLAQRNANPQMVAERALFALHAAARAR
jgi:hypothetical protein